MRKVRILHVSTAHQPQDPRIVFKQCQTLSTTYEVFCALPHAKTDIASNVHFIRLPYFRHVIWRIFFTSPLVLLRCLWLRPKVVHVYVPEFVPFAFVFQLFGAQVIYEVQENLHKKMHLKAINNGYWLVKAFQWFDQLARQHFYLVFTEHAYLDTYTELAKPHVVIYNYPCLSFIEPFRRPYQPNREQPLFFYIGWLSFERAFDILVDAFTRLKTNYPNFVVHLFGRQTFSNASLNSLRNYKAVSANFHYHGYTDQRNAFPYAAHATAGLALLKPVGDYPDSYTTKLFEYMALGLPVITSDFPLYQDVVERHKCGFCVSPYDDDQVARTLTYLIEHPAESQEMGQRGRNAVEEEYNWASEAQKLLSFYALVLEEVNERKTSKNYE